MNKMPRDFLSATRLLNCLTVREFRASLFKLLGYLYWMVLFPLKRPRIYPDFIFVATKNNGSRQITVLEAKGDHLDGADMAYKRYGRNCGLHLDLDFDE